MNRPPTAIRAALVAVAAALAACSGGARNDPAGSATGIPDLASAQIAPPPGVAPDGCWVRDVAPAILKTVTQQVEIAPARIAEDGTVLAPARFRTETTQEIERERQELIFETPCPGSVTPQLIETLQRALRARGLYKGSISGEMDIPTRQAIRRYQTANGLASGLLSIQTARGLGLIETPRDLL